MKSKKFILNVREIFFFFFAFSRWHKQPQWIANRHIQGFNTITVLVNWAVTQRSIGCFINEYMNQMRRLRIPYWSYIKTAAGLILFLKSLISFFVVYRAIDIHCFERKMFQRCILWLSPFESIIDWSAQPVWNIFTNECACKNNPLFDRGMRLHNDKLLCTFKAKCTRCFLDENQLCSET